MPSVSVDLPLTGSRPHPAPPWSPVIGTGSPPGRSWTGPSAATSAASVGCRLRPSRARDRTPRPALRARQRNRTVTGGRRCPPQPLEHRRKGAFDPAPIDPAPIRSRTRGQGTPWATWRGHHRFPRPLRRRPPGPRRTGGGPRCPTSGHQPGDDVGARCRHAMTGGFGGLSRQQLLAGWTDRSRDHVQSVRGVDAPTAPTPGVGREETTAAHHRSHRVEQPPSPVLRRPLESGERHADHLR